MVILKMWGGFGNQLFLYALYKELEYRGKVVKADISNYNGIDIREYLLEDFNVNLNYATDDDYRAIQKSFGDKIKHLRCKIKGEDWHYIRTFDEINKAYNPEMFNVDDTCIVGYWQDPKYFPHVQDIIRKTIVFKEYPELSDIKNAINAANSVSLHIRLTDYLTSDASGLGGVCTEKYYRNAINIIKEKVESPVFFVFSDDIEGARRLLDSINDIEFNFVDTKEIYKDMFLMSQCKHHIMANSSFSWWGTFFGNNEDAVVVAPEIWNLKKPEWDLYLPGWIKAER